MIYRPRNESVISNQQAIDLPENAKTAPTLRRSDRRNGDACDSRLCSGERRYDRDEPRTPTHLSGHRSTSDLSAPSSALWLRRAGQRAAPRRHDRRFRLSKSSLPDSGVTLSVRELIDASRVVVFPVSAASSLLSSRLTLTAVTSPVPEQRRYRSEP